MTSPAPAQNPSKFIFDTVFDGDSVITSPRPKRLYTAEEVEAVRQRAFAEGEGSVVAAAETEQARALAAIAEAARDGLAALAHAAHEHRSASARLALTAATKIAGAALERFPEAPATAAIEALAREIETAPRLVARVAPEGSERIAAALERAAQSIGFTGQIVVDPDPALPPAAFGFDWGDGRASFDPDAAIARVLSLIHI